MMYRVFIACFIFRRLQANINTCPAWLPTFITQEYLRPVHEAQCIDWTQDYVYQRRNRQLKDTKTCLKDKRCKQFRDAHRARKIVRRCICGEIIKLKSRQYPSRTNLGRANVTSMHSDVCSRTSVSPDVIKTLAAENATSLHVLGSKQ